MPNGEHRASPSLPPLQTTVACRSPSIGGPARRRESRLELAGEKCPLDRLRDLISAFGSVWKALGLGSSTGFCSQTTGRPQLSRKRRFGRRIDGGWPTEGQEVAHFESNSSRPRATSRRSTSGRSFWLEAVLRQRRAVARPLSAGALAPPKTRLSRTFALPKHGFGKRSTRSVIPVADRSPCVRLCLGRYSFAMFRLGFRFVKRAFAVLIASRARP